MIIDKRKLRKKPTNYYELKKKNKDSQVKRIE